MQLVVIAHDEFETNSEVNKCSFMFKHRFMKIRQSFHGLNDLLCEFELFVSKTNKPIKYIVYAYKSFQTYSINCQF
jgi:hypothetical protein